MVEPDSWHERKNRVDLPPETGSHDTKMQPRFRSNAGCLCTCSVHFCSVQVNSNQFYCGAVIFQGQPKTLTEVQHRV